MIRFAKNKVRPGMGTLLAFVALSFMPRTLHAQDATKSIDFPCRLGLKSGKWKSFSEGRVSPMSVAELLKEDPDGSQLVRFGDSRYTSIWAGVMRKLAEEPQVIAQLRDAHERGAQALVDEAGGDLDKLMVVARRFPWADSVHKALLHTGSRELRQGHSQLAYRCFLDVRTRSADSEARAQAQVGLWLAAAHDPEPDALAMGFKGIDPKEEYPWMGKKLSAQEIRERLQNPSAPAPATLKELQHKVLVIPDSVSWMYGLPAVYPEGLVVAGPSSLAWYDGSGVKPAWSKLANMAPANKLWGALVAAPVQPSVGAGRVYARWGVHTLPTNTPGRGYNLLLDLAAFDVLTGKQAWSTVSLAEWTDNLCPVNDPVYADGRVYVLAVSRYKEYTPIHLVCLDAQNGSLLWKRELVTNHTTLSNGIKANNIDVAHYGNAVCVAQGSVFCATSMGVLACCDARDGVVEWARTYPQERNAAALGRPGSAPLVAGGRVAFLPRDAGICLTLDPASGELGWLKTDEASLQFFGAFDQAVILGGGRKLSALELDGGKARWERTFPETVDGNANLAGNAIYVGTRSKLYRLDAKSGEIAEEQAWGKSGPMSGLALRDRVLYGTRGGTEMQQ